MSRHLDKTEALTVTSYHRVTKGHKSRVEEKKGSTREQ